MSSAETTEIFSCTPKQFFDLVTDYEKYSEFLSEVKECKVVGNEGGRKLVEYQISLIKNFSYRLWMTEEENKVSWTFDSGDLFKVSSGHWALEEAEGGKTKAHYAVEAKFKVFVPGPIAKSLVNVNLPSMMSSYHKRVEQLYG